MSKLNEKSNFELNRMIAEIEFPNAEEIPPFGEGAVSNEDEVQVIHKLAFSGEIVNYTGDWAQMGPLMIENCIQYKFDTCQVHVSSCFHESAKCSARHSELLRAAAICFLMMKEAE